MKEPLDNILDSCIDGVDMSTVYDELGIMQFNYLKNLSKIARKNMQCVGLDVG